MVDNITCSRTSQVQTTQDIINFVKGPTQPKHNPSYFVLKFGNIFAN